MVRDNIELPWQQTVLTIDTLETTYTVRYEKGIEAEMCPVIVSGIVTGHVPVSYWSIFVLSQKSLP